MCPALAYYRWPLVVASRDLLLDHSRLLGLALRLSRSCLSMPPENLCHAGGWHLRRKPRGTFLHLLFPCGILSFRYLRWLVPHWKRLPEQRAQTKSFFFQQGDIVFHFLILKNRQQEKWQKKNLFRKDVTKKEKRRRWRRDDIDRC